MSSPKIGSSKGTAGALDRSADTPVSRSQPKKVAPEPCVVIRAYDNYQGRIEVNEVCESDFEAFNNTRWAHSRPAPIQASEPGRPAAQAAAPSAASAAKNAFNTLLSYAADVDHHIGDGPYLDRLEAMNDALSAQTRAAAGVSAAYDALLARRERLEELMANLPDGSPKFEAMSERSQDMAKKLMIMQRDADVTVLGRTRGMRENFSYSDPFPLCGVQDWDIEPEDDS